MLPAGSAQTNITPPAGTPIAGPMLLRWSEGIYDELGAQALVLDDGRMRVAFVSCDVLAIGNQTGAAIRQAIADQGIMSAEHVLLGATHTHSGPATTNVPGTHADPAYLKQFAPWVVEAVSRAREAMVPRTHLEAPVRAIPPDDLEEARRVTADRWPTNRRRSPSSIPGNGCCWSRSGSSGRPFRWKRWACAWGTARLWSFPTRFPPPWGGRSRLPPPRRPPSSWN